MEGAMGQSFESGTKGAITRRTALAGAALAAGLPAAPARPAPPPPAPPAPVAAGDLDLPRHKVDLVAPPFAHPHEQVATKGPRILEFLLTIEEKKIVVDDEGTTLQAMTFNGSVPGPLLVV